MLLKKPKLTTRLNIQFVCLMAILMAVVLGHSLWVSVKEKEQKGIQQIQSIASFLAVGNAGKQLGEVMNWVPLTGWPRQEQVLAVNRELQPVLESILVPDSSVRYGIYSRQLENIVIIGPGFDRSLLVGVNPELLASLHGQDDAAEGSLQASLEWYGAPCLYSRQPIVYNGQVIGHAFALLNVNTMYSEAWKRAKESLVGAFVVLLLIVIIFQDVFIRLKRDLGRFAEEMTKDRGRFFESELPEFTPLLKYISKQSEKMANLERLNMVGEMAASIGHEVRNPMTTVRGFLQYLSNKRQFEAHKDHFSLMIEEIDRANSIITEFLSLAKNQAMDFKQVSLNQVITDLFPLIQADAIRNRCYIKLDLHDIVPLTLDTRSIRQLILNMVRNSIEAMPQGGAICLSTAQLKDLVVFKVIDQGTGIAPEVLPKLGVPFVTSKENGTGLGLAICYRIAHRHGASISVKSAASGTIFTITFNALTDKRE